jgi:hypothetical protein
MMYTLEVDTGLAGEPPRGAGACRGTVPGDRREVSCTLKVSISHGHQKTSRPSPAFIMDVAKVLDSVVARFIGTKHERDIKKLMPPHRRQGLEPSWAEGAAANRMRRRA